MGLLKEFRIKGKVEIHSDKTNYGEGVHLTSVGSMKVFSTQLNEICIPEPAKREIVHRTSPDNTFCSETIGEYPAFLTDSEITSALRNKRYLALVTRDSITIFMANFNDEGPVREFLKKARFRLHKNGDLVLN